MENTATKIETLYNIINRLKVTKTVKKKDIESLEDIADTFLLEELNK